jgi:hypothetical protein
MTHRPSRRSALLLSGLVYAVISSAAPPLLAPNATLNLPNTAIQPRSPALTAAKLPDLNKPPQGSISFGLPVLTTKNGMQIAHTWFAGNRYDIKWSTYQTSSDQVEVAFSGANPAVIASPVSSGQTAWTVPLATPPGTYELRVSNVRDYRVFATQPVKVEAARLQVTTYGYVPGTSSVAACSGNNIGWESYGNPGPVNAQLYGVAANGALTPLQSLGSNIPFSGSRSESDKVNTYTILTGSVPWNAPATRTPQRYAVRVASAAVPAIQAMTAYVDVKPLAVEVNSFAKLYPLNYEPQPVTFEWRYSPCLANHMIRIELLGASGQTLFTVASGIPMSTGSGYGGSLKWNLPPEYCATYTIRISDLTDPSIVGTGTLSHTDKFSSGPRHDQTIPKPAYCKY